MTPMYETTAQKGRIHIRLQAVPVGEDLCVILSGGNKPHIGCVALSLPRASLLNNNKGSSTTSVLNLLGHKDDEVASFVSSRLSAALQKNVVVAGGIHVDNITEEEINIIKDLITRLTEDIVVREGASPET